MPYTKYGRYYRRRTYARRPRSTNRRSKMPLYRRNKSTFNKSKALRAAGAAANKARAAVKQKTLETLVKTLMKSAKATSK